MVVTIPYAGVIRHVAIYAQRYEGYAYWWNGGTLQEMFDLDNRYGENIYQWMKYENTLDKDLFIYNISFGSERSK
jgi:hypothetical protein